MKFGIHGRNRIAGAHEGQRGVAQSPRRSSLARISGSARTPRRAEEDAPGVRVEHQRLARSRTGSGTSSPVQERRARSAAVAINPSSPINSYIRVSSAYWVRNALNANSDRRGQACPAAEQAPARPHPDRDRQQPEDQRQRVRRRLAGAETLHPEVQQHVVQRRRCRHGAGSPGIARQRVRGDARRDRLVDPELARQRSRSHKCRDRTSTTSTAETIAQLGSSESDRRRPARGSPAGRVAGEATVVNAYSLGSFTPCPRQFSITVSSPPEAWLGYTSAAPIPPPPAPCPRSAGLRRFRRWARTQSWDPGQPTDLQPVRTSLADRQAVCADAGKVVRRPGPRIDGGAAPTGRLARLAQPETRTAAAHTAAMALK